MNWFFRGILNPLFMTFCKEKSKVKIVRLCEELWRKKTMKFKDFRRNEENEIYSLGAKWRISHFDEYLLLSPTKKKNIPNPQIYKQESQWCESVASNYQPNTKRALQKLNQIKITTWINKIEKFMVKSSQLWVLYIYMFVLLCMHNVMSCMKRDDKHL